MHVNDHLIENLADLCRLSFNEEEKEGIKRDLQKMITFVEKLNEVDTTNIPPLLFMTEESNTFRNDVVNVSITREEGLQNAPVKDEMFFKVPKVIRK